MRGFYICMILGSQTEPLVAWHSFGIPWILLIPCHDLGIPYGIPWLMLGIGFANTLAHAWHWLRQYPGSCLALASPIPWLMLGIGFANTLA